MTVPAYPSEVEGNKLRHHPLLRSVICSLGLLGRLLLLHGQHRDKSEQPIIKYVRDCYVFKAPALLD